MTSLAIVLFLGASVMRFLDREHTGSQSGEDAENEKPCEDVTHDGFSDKRPRGNFK